MRHVVAPVPILLIALLAGCSAVPEQPRPAAQRIPDAAPFLLETVRGYPLSVAPSVSEALQSAHQELIRRSAVEAAYETASILLQRQPDLAPAMVLEAQALLVEGRNSEAIERLKPVVQQLPSYDAAQLVLGRAAEETGLSIVALEAFGALRERSQLAASRFAAVRQPALRALESAVDNALGRRRLEDARESLEVMKRWAPEALATLTATAKVSAAGGDTEGELFALRQLGRATVLGQELQLRMARLELDVGEASAGLRIFQDLSAADPSNSRLVAELARAQFLWRLGLLPEKVEGVAKLPELTRGDFAVLLFWLFPSVRYGQAETGRIANDVLDHPHRQEIVRVVNLGVMSIDSRLHRFVPEQRLTRAGVIAPILRVLGRHQPRPACLEGYEVSGRVSPGLACELGVRCGLLAEAAECLPDLAPSGDVTLEWTRRALTQLGVE